SSALSTNAHVRFRRMVCIVTSDSCRARTMPGQSSLTSVAPVRSTATPVPMSIVLPTCACASAGASLTTSCACQFGKAHLSRDLEMSHVAWSTGRDLLLVPSQRGDRLLFFAGPYAEVDGRPHPVERAIRFAEKYPSPEGGEPPAQKMHPREEGAFALTV